MKIKPGFELRDVCGEKVVIASGIENINFDRMVSLNESAAYLWKKIADHDFTLDEMTSWLCEEYDVDAPTARRDVQQLLDSWRENGLIA